MRRFTGAAGFSLLEVLIAASLVAIVAASLAQLVARAFEQSIRTRRSVAALTLAQSKLEYLRALPWDFDGGGVRVSSAELALSPSTTLTADQPPYVERLNRGGQPAGADTAAFVRRWGVTTPSVGDPDTLLLTVCVFTIASRSRGVADACVWSLRTRRP